MESILNVVVPVFGLVLTGYIAGKIGLLGKASSEALNGFVFYFSLPVLLFFAMAKIDASSVVNVPFITAYLGGQIVTLSLGILVARRIFGISAVKAATHGTAGIYGNVGYMGIPLALTAFGETALPPVVIATIINAALNIAVLTAVIEGQRHGQNDDFNYLRVLGSVLKSPILAAPILGFCCALIELPMPTSFETYGSILGSAAGPCALFSIGLSLVGLPVSEGRSEITSMVILKLVIHPVATWCFAIWLLSDQPQLFTICVLMAALPTGANLYVLAQKYQVYVARTSSGILASTVLSLGTLSAFFYWFA